MNCKDFLTEFEDRKPLTERANAHLNDCEDCKKTNAEQARVWQMIENLQAVDAPKDFDFRLKARIANAKPTDYKPRLLPDLRYLLPLAAAVLIFAFVISSGIRFGGEIAPQIAENSLKPQNAESANEIVNSFAAQTETAVEETAIATGKETVSKALTPNEQAKKTRASEANARFVAVKTTRKIESRRIEKAAKSNDAGGSRDSASTSPTVLVSPESPSNATEPAGKSLSTAEEILSRFGVETVFQNNAWQVKNVKPNSRAARSGVKINDKIEAIDGKKITVTRKTETIEIPLER